MKRLLLFLLLVLFSLTSFGQWFRGPLENQAVWETRWYRYYPGTLTSQLPVYWAFQDTGKVWIIRHDTIFLSRFANKNDDPGGNTFLTVDANGRLRGTSKSSLLSDMLATGDTSAMLTNYFRKFDTTGRWAPKLPYLLSYTETDPLSIKPGDTSIMLSGYLRKADTLNKWAPKLPYLLQYTETDPLSLRISDTSNAFSGYLRKVDTTNKWAPKLNYITTEADPLSFKLSDTATRLSGYFRKSEALTKLNSSDTGTMLLGYVRANGTASQYINGVGAKVAFPAGTVYTGGPGINVTGNVITRVNTTVNNSPTVTIGTSAIINATRNVRISYSVSVTTSLALLNLNSSGIAYLEISPDNTNWTVINVAGISRALGVSITISINETSYYNMQGTVPAGWYRRIRTVTTGGGTVTYTAGQDDPQ